MDLQLTINAVPFVIQDSLDQDKLDQAKAKKLGFLARRVIQTQPGETVFFSKNPTITLFDSSIAIVPCIWDSSGNVDRMFGTSAYLFFTKSRLTRIGLQTIDNQFVASAHTALFRELAAHHFGPPSKEHPRFVSWTDGNLTVASEISPDDKHAYFHWFIAAT